ncbi:hypothetical protein FEM48_Zijuj05G0046100 [Ziziphus jujuba var. spinosa]|uniref:DEK-C domain-containing protein n=1 Tax=Ziziphus jujuba var. spinosa TaxID=714518 RepID=A0A978VCV1_ZIZJJ|nr:hypothetical protein FEM48_Zijuj05G0046100 [Ziziphus jujuba var. spinosa]
MVWGSGNKDQSVSKKRVREPAVKKAGEDSLEEKKDHPVTPAIERPARERKLVERYSAPSTPRSSASKALSIEKGRGTQLKDIPNVAFKLAKRKPDDNLQLLHTILFGKKAKAHSLKRNIGQFSGYVWVENEQEKQRAKVKEKLDKCIKEKLMDFCDVLNIPISKASTRKEELSARLLEFLESPHATTDILLADKEQKGQKRRRKSTQSKSGSTGEASPETPAKKQKQTPNVGKKRKDSSKVEDEGEDKAESSDVKDDSHEEENEDTVHEESGHGDKSDEEEEDKKDQQSTPKSSSKRAVKESTGSKTGGKTAPVKKSTPAKSTKNPAESTPKKSRSSSKRGASDADGTSGSRSKSKGSTSKKQKIEKEGEKDVKVKAASKKKSSRSSSKVSAKDQGELFCVYALLTLVIGDGYSNGLKFMLEIVKGKNSKKAKAEPTKEEMHSVIVDILKRVDFNTATLSDILRQLGSHFGVDLMHRKAEVKDIITEVINNMSDEEDEGDEAEENTEAGDDGEKDEDKDDDDDEQDGDDDDD